MTNASKWPLIKNYQHALAFLLILQLKNEGMEGDRQAAGCDRWLFESHK
jgi:hypothetical protein